MDKDWGDDMIADAILNQEVQRLKGYLQPTFSSTPQLALITATLSRQMKVNRIWNFCHHGKLSLGSNSNSRLNKKVISGAILLLPLICPHKLKDFSKTHEVVDTPAQDTPQRKDAWTRAGRCNQQWRPQLTDPFWRVPKGCQELCNYVFVHVQVTG